MTGDIIKFGEHAFIKINDQGTLERLGMLNYFEHFRVVVGQRLQHWGYSQTKDYIRSRNVYPRPMSLW